MPKAILRRMVSAWNDSSFESYSRDFTQNLRDHYHPAYFGRLRSRTGRWLSNNYLGELKQGACCVHLWRSRFENVENDVLMSLTLNAAGKVAGVLKRASKV